MNKLINVVFKIELHIAPVSVFSLVDCQGTAVILGDFYPSLTNLYLSSRKYFLVLTIWYVTFDTFESVTPADTGLFSMRLTTPWTAAYQAPPSMGFSRQEYWSWVPLPSPLVLSGRY